MFSFPLFTLTKKKRKQETSKKMNTKTLEEKGFKDWYKNINQSQGLCLTDDIDSLLSCIVLQKMFNIHILGFCNFNKLYLSDTYKKEKLIGVDYDLFKGKCFGNHVTYFDNPDNINLNKNITIKNYCNKFAGSTLITILSLYDINLDNLSKLKLQLLLCIDSAFKQFEFNPKRFEYYYRDVLGYPQLINIVKSTSKEEFRKLQDDFNMLEKINIDNNGKLNTKIDLGGLSIMFNFDLNLPKTTFKVYQIFNNVSLPLNQLENFLKKEIIVVSSAVVGKRNIRLSTV